MSIQIDRNKGIPLYIQLKNQIIKAIKSGEFKTGERMATEREMANELMISRKTVTHAYNLLEKEGILVPHQGKGTFVSDSAGGWKSYSEKEIVMKFVDLAIDSAFENEVTSAEFLDMVKTRLKEKEAILSKAQAVFVECNIEQARSFAEQLTEKTNFKLIPITVSELEEMSDSTRRIVEGSKVVIPTFNHVNEVNDILNANNIEKSVMGVAIKPNLETIVKIAKFSDDTRFGLVSLSQEFFYKIDYELKSAGLNNLNIKATTSHNKKELNSFLQDVDVIIVSPGRLEEIEELVESKKEVIRFDYSLDTGSLKAIMSRLVERE